MNLEQEQNEFRSSTPSFLGRGIESITSPATKIASKFLPSSLIDKIVKAIDTGATEPQLVKFKHDQSDISKCQNAAQNVGRTAQILNGATGAVSGFGGALTTTTDIPATIALAVRNIRDTGRAYGYEGDGAAEQLFRLQILEIAALNDKEVRQERIADLEKQIAKNGLLLAPDPAVNKPLTDQAVERVSRALALAIPQKKAGSFMPIVGAVISAAVNSSFQSDVSRAARFAFQERRLRTDGSK